MTALDRFIQNYRIDKARPFIAKGARVLDLGSADGVLFARHGQCGPGSMGIDPVLPSNTQTAQGFTLVRGYFPGDLPANAGPFDAIVMLAVLEHFPDDQTTALADGIAKFLRPGGRLIITVPSPAVDQILDVLVKLRLVHGMSLEEHHGFDVNNTPKIFGEPRFRLIKRGTFQLGLNNLFVFERMGAGD
ncbi:MAG TPA: class I SAM-dependent methyltransferase [Candidatus Limnocylindria bacterium]|nr:class I SAM-dependent methyltransferase [Candidatus Limnocylindria bacterium]